MTVVIRQEIPASVTDRGQVTIPAEVRRLLGLTARDKVNFVIDGETVVLRRPKYTIETAFGSLKPSVPLDGPVDWEAEIRAAKDEKADETEQKLARGEV